MVFFVVIALKLASQSVSFYLRSKYFFDNVSEGVDDIFLLFKEFECLPIDDQMQSKKRFVVVEDLILEGDEGSLDCFAELNVEQYL